MNCPKRLALLAAAVLASTAVAAQTSLIGLVPVGDAPPAEAPRDSSENGAERATGSIAKILSKLAPEAAAETTAGIVSGSIGAPSAVSEEQIKSELRERGVAALQGWRRDGGVYRAQGEWFGEPVDLHVDAATGAIKQPERLKGTQIETMLKIQGWQGVRDVKRGGDTFSVRAERDSRLYELKIDSKTGEILEWKPS